ncbi:hypothetical protein AB7645_31555 [Bradyrhizobium sp. 956_D2_N1_5]|uniref:hypothetical protein n=1 Tax=unclassified Bradyrhizobium TaxID=2631580 RepID=UPI003F27A396
MALLISKSEDAVETFISHCDIAARDLLMPNSDVVMASSSASSAHWMPRDRQDHLGRGDAQGVGG